jgi:hypothetical protein
LGQFGLGHKVSVVDPGADAILEHRNAVDYHVCYRTTVTCPEQL